MSSHAVKKIAGQALLSAGLALAALGLTSGTAHAFDPQPDPPAKPNITEIKQKPSQPHAPLNAGRVRHSSSTW
jgi:hypothetical protein